MGTKVHSLFVRCAEPRRVADAIAPLAREADLLALALVPAGEWTVVLADDLDDLDVTAQPLSSALDAPVVHTRVLDGDAAQMRLVIGGEDVAWLATPPRMFRRRTIGKIDAWRPLLGEGADEIERAWRDDDVSLEERVAMTAQRLGIDRRLALDNVHALAGDHPGRIDLEFQEQDAAPELTGPPRLWCGGGSLEQEEVAVGERVELFARFENDGGSGHGARLTVAGSALERGLVELEELSIPGVDRWRRVAGVPDRAVSGDLDLPVPAGRCVANVHASIRGVAPGDGELTITMTPSRGTEARCSIELVSYAGGRRPLRAIDGPAALHGLWRPDAVHAWIVLDEPRQRAIDIGVDAILRFHRLLELPPDATYRRFSAAPRARFRDGSVRAAKLDERAIRTWMRDASMLDLSLAGSPTSDGATLELMSIVAERSPQHAVPHIGLRVTMAKRSKTELAALEHALVSIVDDIVSRTRARQAFVDRWSGVFAFDATAYERACGVDGQCTTQSWWVDRWLRAVAPHTWIGQPLLKRIAPKALARITDVRTAENGTLYLRTSPRDLSKLEQALAPVLPDARAWERGMKRLHGH